MKKYSEFVVALLEAKSRSGENYVNVVDDNTGPFGKPVDRVHKDNIIEELEEYLLAKENGYLQYVTVSADVTKSGGKRPEYLADILPVVKRTRTPDAEDRAADDKPDDINTFVDVEFEVVGIEKGTKEVKVYKKEIDPATGKERSVKEPDPVTGEMKKVQIGTEIVDDSRIIAMPYSLRRKGVVTPIDPEDVWEISFKKFPKKSVS
jgi:hypothetical protein